jgi:hypothetical protein
VERIGLSRVRDVRELLSLRLVDIAIRVDKLKSQLAS